MTFSIASDIKHFKIALSNLPVLWEGKACVLELKVANYNWRQMEWWAFYFEFKAKQCLSKVCGIPGGKINRVEFDLKTQINWDLKARAIKTDSRRVILNDKFAMEQSIKENGYHGEIITLCDVEYNDVNRSFQKWHTELKGGLSDYEKRRRARSNSFSRYRKTSAELVEIIYIVFEPEDLPKLDVMNQGRNSNGKPRPPKYSLNLERINEYWFEKQQFAAV